MKPLKMTTNGYSKLCKILAYSQARFHQVKKCIQKYYMKENFHLKQGYKDLQICL